MIAKIFVMTVPIFVMIIVTSGSIAEIWLTTEETVISMPMGVIAVNSITIVSIVVLTAMISTVIVATTTKLYT